MEVNNLLQLLEKAAKIYPEHGLHFYLPGRLEGVGKYVTYPSLLALAKENAKFIQGLGLRAEDVILLHFNNHIDNLEWFWAVIYAGHVPAFSTPFTNNMEQRRKHILHLNSIMNDPICLTSEELLPEFSGQDVLRVRTINKLVNGGLQHTERGEPNGSTNGHKNVTASPGILKTRDELAVLMLTSGSTGNAKAVSLTHANILTSIAGKEEAHNIAGSGPFLNWIGVDHVAGLTEIHMYAIYVGAEQVHIQAADLVPSPLLFLDLIYKHRVAYSFAPNFFLAALRRAAEVPGALNVALDLSCLKTITTGGEANVVETCVALTEILHQRGAPNNVLSPGFGMTETCAGSVFSKDCPRRDIECKNEFATVGAAITGMKMRITDENGKEIGYNAVGNLEVNGPIIFREYLNNPEATQASFNGDWFITGDRGFIDSLGQLNLTGRAKDTVIINGINYLPQELEMVLEDIPGAVPSYTVVFPYRPKGSQTENICVVYLPAYNPEDVEKRVETNDAIAKAAMLQTGVRPYVIPLNATKLQKTTLGKLSRPKIRSSFEKGDFQTFQTVNEEVMAQHRRAKYEGPANHTEQLVLGVFQEIFEVPQHDLGVNTNIFTMGVNSIDIIKVKKRLQVELKIENVPIITVMTNPTIRSLSTALETLQKPREYNPMVVLQSEGSKTPLWLIHPGLGEVIVFLSLAPHMNDRPVYAMRARGFEQGEKYFLNIEDAVITYHTKIKSIQPQGPYAIAGYSYGSMIAFEVTKLLNSYGDEVKFLGAFNLPPHIKFRMRQLDWTNCLLHLSYFLDFFSEEYAHMMHPKLNLLPREEVLNHVVSVAPKDRMEELGLNKDKLTNWADLAYSLQSSATDYEPSGMVESIDVFCATPLAAVAKDIEDWKTNHLAKWADFSKTKPRLHEVDGAHYTMISPTHVYSFQKKLKAALANRGV